MSKFIYFPSFSAGEYGDKLKKDFRYRALPYPSLGEIDELWIVGIATQS